jgi:hypothetical protein
MCPCRAPGSHVKTREGEDRIEASYRDKWFARMMPLVETGRREFFRIEG